MQRWVGAVLTGQAVGLLGQVDLAFIPLVLVVPAVTGALSAGWFPLWIPCLAWTSAGLTMTVLDWLSFPEDVVFYLALTGVMAALAAVGWWLARLILGEGPASGAA